MMVLAGTALPLADSLNTSILASTTAPWPVTLRNTEMRLPAGS
jgi:hypothetical protein